MRHISIQQILLSIINLCGFSPGKWRIWAFETTVESLVLVKIWLKKKKLKVRSTSLFPFHGMHFQLVWQLHSL